MYFWFHFFHSFKQYFPQSCLKSPFSPFYFPKFSSSHGNLSKDRSPQVFLIIHSKFPETVKKPPWFLPPPSHSCPVFPHSVTAQGLFLQNALKWCTCDQLLQPLIKIYFCILTSRRFWFIYSKYYIHNMLLWNFCGMLNSPKELLAPCSLLHACAHRHKPLKKQTASSRFKNFSTWSPFAYALQHNL